MDFRSIVLFLILYYVRPQEWIGFIAALRPVTLSVAFALLCMVLRKRGFHWRELLQTPHDWMVLLYFIWIVGSNSSPIAAFGHCNNLFVFYFVTVQALSSPRRIRSFLGWWTFMILMVAGLAVLSEYGFDLMHSTDLTHGHMKGRLVLNTSIFNNPNALGHSVYPVVLMLYFLCFWKRPVFMKVGAILLVMLPLYCIFLTLSKGAFVALFATIILALSFGRPRSVQILVLVLAMTIGWSVLWALPRMPELNRARSDQAIQGRVAAFRFGLDTLKHNIHGLGQGGFGRAFTRVHKFAKAAHSSYVEIGAELGLPGLFLFIGILYTCLRTLWQVKTRDSEEERNRRILFAMLIAYAVSSWMVNYGYRASFFLLAATIAAFHRQMLPAEKAARPLSDEAGAEVLLPAPAGFGVLQLAPAAPSNVPVLARGGSVALLATVPLAAEVETPKESKPPGLLWNRIGGIDWALIAFFTCMTVCFWDYIMRRM